MCEYDVKRILKKIGDEEILLQLDGYESYLNALEEIDEDGQINEVVSPGDCTDFVLHHRLGIWKFCESRVQQSLHDTF